MYVYLLISWTFFSVCYHSDVQVIASLFLMFVGYVSRSVLRPIGILFHCFEKLAKGFPVATELLHSTIEGVSHFFTSLQLIILFNYHNYLWNYQ